MWMLQQAEPKSPHDTYYHHTLRRAEKQDGLRKKSQKPFGGQQSGMRTVERCRKRPNVKLKWKSLGIIKIQNDVVNHNA